MLGFMKEVNNIKLKDFLKTFALGEATKISVKNEFKRFNDHIMIIQKHVNDKLAGIMKELAESTREENKLTPAIQTSGTETRMIETKYSPMNNYNKSELNDYRLTIKSTWIQ